MIQTVSKNECEGNSNCLRPLRFIVDCDECKNIFVCDVHVGMVINQHADSCAQTLHVDFVGAKDADRTSEPE